MPCLINLNLNRVMGHHQGYVAFEIKISPFARFGRALIRNILVSRLYLEENLSNQFET